MKVSLNTIKQYIDFELPPVDELVARINERLGQVEEVTDLTEKYKDAVIVKVVECEKHPDADRLSVCKIDAGSSSLYSKFYIPDSNLIQVVCGAPNAHAGMLAVWLPPSATVPASFGTPEPFVLSARELRGVMSQGMLAAADELAIGSDHNGIIEIDPNEWTPTGAQIAPGVSFAKAFGLDDTVIDIENKMFTHRPDCFGQLGVAREIAGILGEKFASPEWYWQLPSFGEVKGGDSLPLIVTNEAPENVPRFMAVALRDVTVKPSPLWLQCELVRLGSKPINNIVDVTNYVMLLTAQPTHAYDYDTLRGNAIAARMAREGESATLLNGKTYTLTADDVVIADGEGVIGLAGVMGGGESEVSATTTNIVLEVATFDMYAVRKTSMRHGLFTDALTRFNKGQSLLQNDRVLQLLLQSVQDVAGGVQASNVADVSMGNELTLDVQTLSGNLAVTPVFINDRLGSDLSGDEIMTLLHNVEIAANEEGGSLNITAPFWRTDISVAEDVVEEVGRLHGFDVLPRSLPVRSIVPVALNEQLALHQTIRSSLAKSGANELLTYSFVHEQVLKGAGQDSTKAFRLSNALSPDLQYYRLGILPSLIDKVHLNSKAGYDEFMLFEIGKAHHKDFLDEDGLPGEFGHVAGVYASKLPRAGAAYFKAKRIVEQLLTDCKAQNVRFQELSEFDGGAHDGFRQVAAPFDPKRASTAWVGEQLVGVVGEFTRSTTKSFKLPEYAAGFELFIAPLEQLAKAAPTYQPLSRYPSTMQDISLRVAADTPYQTIQDAAEAAIASADTGLVLTIEPLTIYQAEADASHKTVTLRLTATSYETTLTDSDVSPLIDAVADAAKAKLGAVKA